MYLDFLERKQHAHMNKLNDFDAGLAVLLLLVSQRLDALQHTRHVLVNQILFRLRPYVCDCICLCAYAHAHTGILSGYVYMM